MTAMTPAAKTKRGEFLQFVAERYGEHSPTFYHLLGVMDTPAGLSLVNAFCQVEADRDHKEA